MNGQNPGGDIGRKAAEPPLVVTSQGIDISPRRTGHARLDMIIAACAIFMSLLSLGIAYNQARMMRQQVAATSWPLLQFSSANTDERNRLAIALSVQNSGVGPAIINRFTIYYHERPYKNAYQLLSDCCGYVVKSDNPARIVAGAPITSFVENTVIRPGEGATFLSMPLVPGNSAVWTKLDKARFQLKFDVCYCSVLGECWRSNLRVIRPQTINSCPAGEEPPVAG